MSSEDPFYNRRAKGTPLQKFRHRVALGVLAVSGLYTAFFYFRPKPQAVIQMIKEGGLKNSEEVEARRFRMSQSLHRSSSAVRKKILEDEDNPVS